MSNNDAIVVLLFLIFLWNILVFGVTAYAVFWLGHSGWWFVLALALSTGGSSVKGRAS